jgi:nucleotide-binding universal stress UspA family protein
MEFKRLVVAIDDSGAGRSATRFAGTLAARSGAQLTVLSVLPAGPNAPAGSLGKVDGLEAMLGKEAFHPSVPVELAAVHGVPQVEIPRYVERVNGDLIVLGRKPRSRSARLILGDTADAVVRRSRLPAMLVPESFSRLRRLTVALDGTDRGRHVLRAGVTLAEAAQLEFNAVTVEPLLGGGGATLATPRSERLASAVEECLHQVAPGTRQASAVAPLRIRQGDPVEEILADVIDSEADVLVVGFHPGGPLLVVEEGSVSRKLLHSVPCAVLTVPL